MHFEELGGIVQLVAFAAAAFVLNFMEQFEGAPGLAGEAMAVDADLGDGALVLEESEGYGKGGFSVLMLGLDAVFHCGDAEREEVGLDRGGTVLSPGSIDKRMDELGLGGAFGLVFIEEGL